MTRSSTQRHHALPHVLWRRDGLRLYRSWEAMMAEGLRPEDTPSKPPPEGCYRLEDGRLKRRPGRMGGA